MYSNRIVFFTFLLLISKEAYSSGGGSVRAVRENVSVYVSTVKKRPVRGGEAAWSKTVSIWESKKRPEAEKVAEAINSTVIPEFGKKIEFLKMKQPHDDCVEDMDEEGVITSRCDFEDSARPFHLQVNLMGDEEERYTNVYHANFLLKKKPPKQLVREFSANVRATARKIRRLPPEREFWAHYETFRGEGKYETGEQADFILMTRVPLAKLGAVLAKLRYEDAGFPKLRRAPVLLINISKKNKLVAGKSGMIVEAPSDYMTVPDNRYASIQVNGRMLNNCHLIKADPSEVRKLLKFGLSPGEEKDTADFLQSIEMIIDR